ncbi:MAG: HAD family hydrolase [Deltaproteobacteria bacterium]|nr:HAD family hydrolase [Deltaproteobacteria bacterium]
MQKQERINQPDRTIKTLPGQLFSSYGGALKDNMMIKGVIFDYGNTLVESPSLSDALVSVFRHDKALEIGNEIEKPFLDLYTPEQKEQPDWLKVWGEAFSKYGVLFNEEIGIQHLRAFADRYKIYDYTKPLLSELKGKSIKLALLGNMTGPAQIFHDDLIYKGLNDYFDCIAWSCEIGYRKPSKEAFQYILDKMALKSEEVVMVGDSEIADIGGAAKIGIKTLRIYDGNKPTNSKADFLSSRGQVINTIEAITFISKRPKKPDA